MDRLNGGPYDVSLPGFVRIDNIASEHLLLLL